MNSETNVFKTIKSSANGSLKTVIAVLVVLVGGA